MPLLAVLLANSPFKLCDPPSKVCLRRWSGRRSWACQAAMYKQVWLWLVRRVLRRCPRSPGQCAAPRGWHGYFVAPRWRRRARLAAWGGRGNAPYKFLVAARWADEENWPGVKSAYFAGMPAPVRAVKHTCA